MAQTKARSANALNTRGPLPHRRGSLTRAGEVAAASLILAAGLLSGGIALLGHGPLRSSDDSAESFRAISEVTLDTDFESVHITGSPTAQDVTMHRTWSWPLIQPRTSAAQDGSRLTVTSSCLGWVFDCQGHLQLVVPSQATVTLRTRDADLIVQGLTGVTNGRIFDGDVELVNTAGTANLEVTDGDLEVAGASGTLSTRLSDGALRATGLGLAEISTVSTDGSVSLSFDQPPRTVRAQVSDAPLEVLVPDDGMTYNVKAGAKDGQRLVSVPVDAASDRLIEVSTTNSSLRIQPR